MKKKKKEKNASNIYEKIFFYVLFLCDLHFIFYYAALVSLVYFYQAWSSNPSTDGTASDPFAVLTPQQKLLIASGGTTTGTDPSDSGSATTTTNPVSQNMLVFAIAAGVAMLAIGAIVGYYVMRSNPKVGVETPEGEAVPAAEDTELTVVSFMLESAPAKDPSVSLTPIEVITQGTGQDDVSIAVPSQKIPSNVKKSAVSTPSTLKKVATAKAVAPGAVRSTLSAKRPAVKSALKSGNKATARAKQQTLSGSSADSSSSSSSSSSSGSSDSDS